MNGINIGYALCGSFCTFSKAVGEMEILVQQGYNIVPVMSFNAYNTDSRFGAAKDFRDRIEQICNRKIISTIEAAEPLGPMKMTDLMVVAPCTGNTCAKLANAVTDTPVTMAVKSHLRQQKPVVVCIATNDALGASAINIGRLLNTRHYYFVPFRQDDPYRKPNSLVADFGRIPDTVKYALEGIQIQPVLAQS